MKAPVTPRTPGSGATITPVTGRAIRSDAVRNRERLLVAAGLVFTEMGLEACVADVARAAGVGMGTLYRRFASKEALIEALVSDVLEQTIAMAREAAERPEGTGLEHFLQASCSYQAKHLGCLPKLWSTDHPLIATARTLIDDLVADAQAHGRVRDDLTSTDISLVLWSMRGVLETTGANAPDAWRRHLDIVVAGMRPAAEALAHRPVSQQQIDRILARRDPSTTASREGAR